MLCDAPTDPPPGPGRRARLAAQPRAAGVDLAAASITTARVRDLIFGSAEPALSLDNASAYGPELAAHSGRWLVLESP
ncbi:MAG: hypothetical protein Tsb0020_10320 [Haliangiales bacterium]